MQKYASVFHWGIIKAGNNTSQKLFKEYIKPHGMKFNFSGNMGMEVLNTKFYNIILEKCFQIPDRRF